jgi:predicted MFS family arabinose efflux permease
MFIAQGAVFSPLVRPDATRWLLMPSPAALAAGLVAIPFVTGYLALVLTVALVAASAGILSPIVTYWISLGDNESQGTALWLQTALASLGQALGSAAGGLLFDSVVLPGASFTIPAAAVLAGLAASFGLPRLLVK